LNLIDIPYIGEFFSLLCAGFWGFAVILLKKAGEKIPAIALNPFKNLLALILFTITLYIMGIPLVQPLIEDGGFMTMNDYVRLTISGIIGIGIADIIFLHSLNIIGASISAIVDTIYSPAVIFFAFFLLGERLTFIQIFGATLVVGAVLYASLKIQHIPASRKRMNLGIIMSAFSIILMALGIILTKPVLEKVAHNVGQQFWVASYRIVPGLIVSSFILRVRGRNKNILSKFKDRSVWPSLVGGSILATYIGLAFWTIGMAFTSASIASVLNQTSTIFIFIFAWLFLGEPMTKRRIVSVIIALIGVFIILLN
jgi:drug/metabolite transporter (DMT)-like permease